MPCASSRSRRIPAIRSTAFYAHRSRSCWCLIARRRLTFFQWFQRERRFRRCCWKKNRHNSTHAAGKLPAGQPVRRRRYGAHMQTFHIRYRNTQGTLMRILNAASRRALDLPVVQAEPAEHDHQVTLALDVNQKQVGQLYREWYSIADVIRVSSGMAQAAEWVATRPPAGVAIEGALAAAG